MKTKRVYGSALWQSILLGLAVTAVLTAAPVFAADTVLANVPFAFKVATKTLPAGDYEFTIHPTNETVVVSSTTNPKGPSAVEEILTRMAAQNSPDARVVFDKVNGQYVLSEIWQPEGEGVLLHATKGKHEHHVLHGRKK